MFKLVPTNQVLVEVSIKQPYLYDLDPETARRKGCVMEDQIHRHVDDWEDTSVKQKYVYRDSNGVEHETLYDALEYWFDEDGALEGYEIRYERPQDNGVGSRTKLSSFKEVIEEAWNNPNKFEIVSGPKLTAAQYKFLNKVLGAAKER
jgi:hypothetical protein